MINITIVIIPRYTINGIPNIVAIERAAVSVYNAMDKVGDIEIGERFISDYETDISIDKYKFGSINKMEKYRFLNPWLALNQNNYKEYKNTDILERKELLQKVLKGNILSMAKNLKYWVENQIIVETEVTPITVNYKNKKMIAVKTLIFLLIFGFLIAYKLERRMFPHPKMITAGDKIGRNCAASRYSNLNLNNKIPGFKNIINNIAGGKDNNNVYLRTVFIK